MKKSIAERMSGKIDAGFYATIPAVAKYLGLSYHRAQRALREEWLGGNLRRGRVHGRLVYSSKQETLF